LYIHGGDFSYIGEDGKTSSYRYNSTYSLDLSTSWSPNDARFTVIDKGDCPLLNRPNLWPAPDGKSFYSFNGAISGVGNPDPALAPPVSPQLWKFTPDGISNGTWSLAGSNTSLTQSVAAVSAFGNGSAYILGGITTPRTTWRYGNSIESANGIVSYNMESQTWNHQSMAGFAPTGKWLEGELHWVDNLGGIGLVAALGGVTAGEMFILLDHVTFFNPITGEWRNQSTTGAIPRPRRRYCSVGVPGDNGTYEV
jgi:hypothetical protein